MKQFCVDPAATFLARILLYIVQNTSATAHLKEPATKIETTHSSPSYTEATQKLHSSTAEREDNNQ